MFIQVLKALVTTGKISQYASSEGKDEDDLPPGQDHASLPALLHDLRQRAEGGSGAGPAGSSSLRPLHIVLKV